MERVHTQGRPFGHSFILFFLFLIYINQINQPPSHSFTPPPTARSDRLASSSSDFLLWFTSRVPPYGYGKSHGLAGAVRLLAFPPLHALEGENDVRDFVRCVCLCVCVV